MSGTRFAANLLFVLASAVCILATGGGSDHWAYQPVRPVTPPAVVHTDWPRSTIDRFILARSRAEQINPAPDAPRAVLMRRLFFDLIGLPPAPDELRAFVADTDPQAVENLVDTLLARPEFGERWARHWFDIARFAESVTLRGLVFDEAWRYRDYVIDAFNRDLPFDQFVTEQIAGDLLGFKTPEERNRARIATTYLVLGNFNYEEQDKEQLRMDIVDEQLDTVARGLLAQTLACARCHNHKTDPIPTADYYAMAGIFRNTRSAEHENVSRWIELPLEIPADEERVFREHELKLAELQRSIRKKVDRIAELTSGAPSGGPSAGPVEIHAGAPGGEGNSTLRDLMAELERLRRAVQRESELGPKRPMAMTVTEEKKIEDGPLCPRGDIHRATTKQARGFLSFGKPVSRTEFSATASGRVELARWIASTNNPLTARVFVNRVWGWLLGSGIVRTPDNFGITGELPTHPELLDDLALRFMHEGWSLKKLIREIVLSRTYQLSSRPDAVGEKLDPENRLFLRASRRRLEPECMRDAILLISGTLDPARGGANIKPGTSADYGYVDTANRRSVYVPAFRNAPPELCELFDGADPSTVTGRRGSSIVAPQALYLMNHPFILENSRMAAERFLSADLDDSSGRIEEAFRWVLGRKPHRGERDAVLAQLNRELKEGRDPVGTWAEVFQALFASVDFRYVD